LSDRPRETVPCWFRLISDQGGIDERLAEVALLAKCGRQCGGCCSGSSAGARPRAFYVGKGKAEEIGTVAQLNEADLVIFNHDITAAQQRNLERKLNCRVVDRSALILDIFALRAKSHEGKLQVELAQLQHLSTRLVRGWTHLERQKGGIGLRGPGEKQLETDRRLLGERVKMLKGSLAA
jgi:GTP-binding protein HflX